jgi:hypothetical protein
VRTLPIIGGLIAVALVIVAREYVAGHWELVLIALPLLAGIALSVGPAATRRSEVLVGVAIASALFCGLLFGWGTVVVDSTRQTDSLFARIRQGDSQSRIAAYKCLESSWVFHGERPFIELQDAATEAKEFHKPATWSPTPRLAPEEYTRLFAGGLISHDARALGGTPASIAIQLRRPRRVRLLPQRRATCTRRGGKGNH